MTDIIHIYRERYNVLSTAISDEESIFVKNNLTDTALGKKSFYLKAGKVQKDMVFIYCGLIRAFYIDHKDHKITMGFIKENQYVIHYRSFSEQQPSRHSF